MSERMSDNMTENVVRARLRDTTINSTNDTKNGVAEDEAVLPRGRRRYPELLLGLLLVVGGALGGVLVFQRSSDRVVVVGAARELTRGTVLTRSDVIAVEVGALPAGAVTSAGDASTLLGKRLLVDIPAGVPIAPNVVTDQQLLEASEALIPLALTRSAVPSGLTRGDFVRVVISFPNQGADAPAPEVLADTIEVFDIDISDDFGDAVRVTVRANSDIAIDIARADRVQLMKVAGS